MLADVMADLNHAEFKEESKKLKSFLNDFIIRVAIMGCVITQNTKKPES